MARCRCMDCDINRMAFAVRIKREFLELERKLRMPLELKGLKGKAIKAAANIDRLNTAYDAFNEAAPAHAADVESLVPQITGLQDDLAFAAQVLGNSVAGSNGNTVAVEKPAPVPTVTQPETVNVAVAVPQPQPAPISPEVEKPSATFQSAGTL